MPFVEDFARDGCAILPRLFDPALIGALHDECARQFPDPANQELPPHLKVGHRRIQLPIQVRGPLLDPMLYAHPLLLAMLAPLLGKNMLIDSLTCVTALPGARDQGLHRDHGSLFEDSIAAKLTLPAHAITVAVPLIDLTAETGTTRLYPGSHRLCRGADGEDPALDEGQLPFVQRGGCYLMDYRLWHQGTENRTDQPRPVLYLSYARHWFIDLENFGVQPRLHVDRAELACIAPAHRPLFRRLAGQGSFDLSLQAMLSGEN